jgi:putative thioredoxin
MSKSYVSEASTSTFAKEVIERSKQTPVLVDFWADWCAPCRILAPMLEQAVEARGGAVWLVKVDTDRNQELAAQFGIRGIPAVKAFVDGQVAAEFVGVQERPAIDAFIDALAPAPEVQALRRAEALLQQGQAAEVSAALEPALQSAHHHDEARLLEARACFALGEVQRAEAALDQVDSQSLVADQVAALRAQGELMGATNGAGSAELRRKVEREPENLDARWALAGALVRDGEHEQALAELLELLQRNRAYREDGARRAMLAIFDSLGADHDLSREYRRKLQIYL